MTSDDWSTVTLLTRRAGLTDASFPFATTYIEQKSGACFETVVGTSACLKALQIKMSNESMKRDAKKGENK